MEEIHNEWIQGNTSRESIDMEKQLMKKWDERCEQEEILWKQKSRNQWLKEGERNTKFFHRSAIDYKCSNRITRLQGEHGEILSSHQDITNQLRRHFQSIATEPEGSRREAIARVTS